jgi:hypothetical protein
LKSLCHLRHSCIVQIYRFARKAKDYKGALVMEGMPDGSLNHVLQQVQQRKRPLFWADTGIAMFVCGVVAGFELAIETD